MHSKHEADIDDRSIHRYRTSYSSYQWMDLPEYQSVFHQRVYTNNPTGYQRGGRPFRGRISRGRTTRGRSFYGRISRGRTTRGRSFYGRISRGRTISLFGN